MAKQNFRELLVEAHRLGFAIGAFNILNDMTARQVILAAGELGVPVIIQTSVSTVKKFGVSPLILMLTSLRSIAQTPVLIHLDHCTEPELARQCIDAGWDSVMIDASHRPFSENIQITKEIENYARQKGVCVEGELGIIRGVEETMIAEKDVLANLEDSLTYIEATGIDAFAPAIGTAHGLYKGDPTINYDLVQNLNLQTDCPIVIHGGTGLGDGVFKRLIEFGASKINVSTAIKISYLGSVRQFMEKNPEDLNPLKLDQYVEQSIRDTVKRHMAVFSGKMIS